MFQSQREYFTLGKRNKEGKKEGGKEEKKEGRKKKFLLQY